MRSARRSKHSGCRLLVLGHVYVGTRHDSQKVSAATDGHRPPPALHFYDFRPGMEAHGPCRPLRRVSGRGRPKRQATALHSPGHRLGRTGVEKALLQPCRTGRGRPKRQATALHSPGHRLGRTGVEKALLQHCRTGRGRPKRQATALHYPGHRLGRTGVEKALLQHCRTHAETPAGVHRDVARAAQAAFLRKRLANALEAWLPAVLRAAHGLKHHHRSENVQQLLFVRRQHPFEKPLQLPAPVRNNTARVAYIRKDDIKVTPVAQVRH